MKQIFFLFISLLFFSCKTLPPTMMFPQNNHGLMLYVTPINIKKNPISYLSIDSTFFISEGKIYKNTSIKYTIAIKNKTKRELTELKYFLKYNEKTVELQKKEIYVDLYSDDIIKIRFESFLNPTETEELLNCDSDIYMDIFENETLISSVNLKEYKEKISKLKIYM